MWVRFLPPHTTKKVVDKRAGSEYVTYIKTDGKPSSDYATYGSP